DGAIDTHDLDVSAETMRTLLTVDREKWLVEIRAMQEYFQGYGARMPAKLLAELHSTQTALSQ
ncbi:MAG: phosphoenolpyruvate carboxykinase domain-containing protein, partial [Gammaproteobacteria bacterium]